MKTYDCFLFFNELDMLELRLHHMAPHVDHFVLVESPVTFTGQPKALLFQENRHRFAAFDGRIRHIVVEDAPGVRNPWERERHQRDSIRRGLADAAPGDTIIVSDVDEILGVAAVAEARARARFSVFAQDLFYFYMDWRVASVEGRVWTKAYAAPYEVLLTLPNLDAPRAGDFDGFLASLDLDLTRTMIGDAGWHFSWTGGLDRMVTKMNAFSHTEPAFQRWNDHEQLAQWVCSQRFFYGDQELETVEQRSDFPGYLQRHWDRFRSLGLLSPQVTPG